MPVFFLFPRVHLFVIYHISCYLENNYFSSQLFLLSSSFPVTLVSQHCLLHSNLVYPVSVADEKFVQLQDLFPEGIFSTLFVTFSLHFERNLISLANVGMQSTLFLMEDRKFITWFELEDAPTVLSGVMEGPGVE